MLRPSQTSIQRWRQLRINFAKQRKLFVKNIIAIWPIWLVSVFVILILSAPNIRPPRDLATTARLPEETGFKLAIDMMLAEGLLSMETLPAVDGRAQRFRMLLNSKILAQDIGKYPNKYSSCGGVKACTKLFYDYANSTFIGQHLQNTSVENWLEDDGRITGIKPLAHGSPRTRFNSDITGGRIQYFDARGKEPAWKDYVLIDPISKRALFRADGQETSLSDCRWFEEKVAPKIRSRGTGRRGELGWQWLSSEAMLVLPDSGDSYLPLIDGVPLQSGESRGNKTAMPSLLPIQSNQILTWQSPDRSCQQSLQLVTRNKNMSALADNGQRVRLAELYTQLAQADPELGRRTVTSSIRRAFQNPLQDLLERQFSDVAGKVDLDIRSAVMMMDGKTGEIVSAATYPTKRAHLARSSRSNPNRLAWLRTNMNFEPLAVGSAAKVPFATAIVLADPQQLDARMPFSPSYNICIEDWVKRGSRAISAQGQKPPRCSRGPLYKSRNLSGGGTVDFESFIGYSNNTYVLKLLRDARVDDTGWEDYMARLACVSPSRDNVPIAGCERQLWRNTGWGDIGPDMHRLSVRKDEKLPANQPWFMMAIGGGDWQWTMAQLAQSYARILTGKAVSPRLTTLPKNRPQNTGPVDINLPSHYQKVAQRVMRGMSLTLDKGTGKRKYGDYIAKRKADGALDRAVYAYAKTGTPDVALTQGFGSVLVLALARSKTGRPPQRPDDICQLSVITFNYQYKGTTLSVEPKTMLRKMLKDPAMLRWINRDCEQ